MREAGGAWVDVKRMGPGRECKERKPCCLKAAKERCSMALMFSWFV